MNSAIVAYPSHVALVWGFGSAAEDLWEKLKVRSVGACPCFTLPYCCSIAWGVALGTSAWFIIRSEVGKPEETVLHLHAFLVTYKATSLKFFWSPL